MTLLLDTFWTEAINRLAPAGWTIVSGNRYDPTHIEGVTPSGRAFTLDCIEGVITLNIAGRTKTISRSRDAWESGTATIDAMIEARSLFPANQR